VDGFSHFILNRTNKHKNAKRDSGGLIIYVRNNLKQNVELLKYKNDRIIWLKINKSVFNSENDVFVCLLYNVPTGSAREVYDDENIYDSLVQDIVEFNAIYENKTSFIITGDFNSRTGNRNDFVNDEYLHNLNMLPDDYSIDVFLPRNSQDKIVNENGKLLIDFCKQTGLRIMNGRVCEDSHLGRYTCIKDAGCSVVDYVLCMPEMMPNFTQFSISDPSIESDHCKIEFSIKTENRNAELNINSENEPRNLPQIDHTFIWDENKRLFFINNLESEEITHELHNLTSNIDTITQSSEIDNNLEAFYNLLNKTCSPFKKNIKNRNKSTKTQNSWYDSECKQKQTDFYETLNNYRSDNSDENRKNMVQVRSQYKSLVRSKKFKHDRKNTEKLINARMNNAKDYWKLLKSICTNNTSTNITHDTFARYFKAVNCPDSTFYQADEDTLHFNERYVKGEFNIMFEELNIEISNDEILKACKELKNNRSGGPDYFINEFFKYGINNLLNYLSKLFNKIFNLNYFPQNWSNGFIIPLHKKGDINNPENYRGITLLSTLGKLFTRILNNRLNAWAENYSVYVEAQAGFRSNMCTTDNIFILHAVIQQMLNNNKKLFVCFVDYTKAFDLLVRENIWHKLIKLGIRGKMLDIITSLYSNVKSCIKFNNCLSESFICNLGVRQGDCLSPFLFAMYINDLEETLILKGHKGISIHMLKLFLLLYADDITIMSENEQDLQHGLDILYQYCNQWKLTLNVQKTKVLIFKKGGRNPRGQHFLYGNQELEIVTNFQYLGITFSSKGSFNLTFDKLAGQALKAIFKLRSYLYKFTDISIEHSLSLFDKLITPILNYASEVWGFNNSKRLETIHLKFCKQLLGVKLQTQNNFIYSELGRFPLKCSIVTNIIRYWFKILKCPETKLVKITYKMMLIELEANPNKPSWVKSLKECLEQLGFFHVWLNQGVENEDLFMSSLKQRAQDIFLQNLNNELHMSSRASTYILFHNFGYKNYLNSLNINIYRQAFTRLRTSSHRLAVETGRWHKPNKIPRNERKCLSCNSLEDEFHFLLECPLYKEIRKLHIKKYYWKHPNIIKFSELMSANNNGILKNLGIYIHKSLVLRENIYSQNKLLITYYIK